MTVHKITSTTSVFSSVAGVPAFNPATTPGTDSLTVDDGGYLVATGSLTQAADLAGPGAWTVNVNGSIFANSGFGLWLRNGTLNSTVNIGTTGEVGSGATTAIRMEDSGSIKNAGTISGTTAVQFSGGAKHTLTNNGTIVGDILHSVGVVTLTNSGTIDGEVFLANGNNVITNSGKIADLINAGTGNDTVTNNGQMSDGINLSEGTNKYTSSSATSYANFVQGGLGNDTVTTAGGISSINLSNGTNSVTILKTGFSESITLGSGNDTVSIAGSVAGDTDLGSGNNSFTNSGTVTGDVDFFAGDDKFTNTKVVIGNVGLGDGTNSFSNGGTFTGNVNGGVTTDDKFTNSGTLTGIVSLGGGNNSFSNTKTLNGNVTALSGNDTFSNTGTLNGHVDLGEGLNTFKNSGTIDGDVNFGSGDDNFTNTKIINGTVNFGQGTHVVTHGGHSNNLIFGSGNDKLTNSGETTEVQLGEGDNILNNSGVIARVFSGSGVDFVTNTGTINTVADLGSGNDKYVGGNFRDRVADGKGSDSYELRGGDDIYYANPAGADGSDKIDGGAGIDHYADDGWNFGQATGSGLLINIDTVGHAEEYGSISVGFLSSNVQANSASGGVGTDIVIGFENVSGRGGSDTHDTIFGSAVANLLRGNGGNDGLFGYGGIDTLEGGAGEDFLCGGAGADKLFGGSGVDSFIYQNVADSGPLKAARDVIFDFEDGVDLIDFTQMDGFTTNGPGIDTFHYLGENVAFSLNDPGAIRVIVTVSGWTIEAETTGDLKADFAIDVVDSDHSITWTAANFIL